MTVGIADAGQVVLRYYDRWECNGPGVEEARDRRKERCITYCDELSTNVNAYLHKGWRIVSSRPVETMSQPFKFTELLYPPSGYCRCLGVEYILEKQ